MAVSEDAVKKSLEDSINWVFSTANIISEYVKGPSKEDKLKELQKTLQDLCHLDKELIVGQKIISKMEEENDAEQLSEYKNLKESYLASLDRNKSKVNYKKHEKYIEFTRNLSQVDADDDDEELVCTEAEINIIDPYTKSYILNPVRNTICNHHYDKAYVMDMLDRRGEKAKCPYAGCMSAPFSKDNLVEDQQLTKKIKQRVEASQKNSQKS